MTQPPEDEWFAPADPGVEDQWLADRRAPRPPAFDPWALVNPPLLAIAGIGVAFFVGLLAAFGAFGGDSPRGSLAITVVQGTTHAPRPPTATAVVTTTTSSSAAPTTPLKPGDSGAQVKTLQRELTALGFPVGTIDGSYGPATSKAVAAFQTAHHLTADGVVGPATLLALAP